MCMRFRSIEASSEASVGLYVSNTASTSTTCGWSGTHVYMGMITQVLGCEDEYHVRIAWSPWASREQGANSDSCVERAVGAPDADHMTGFGG